MPEQFQPPVPPEQMNRPIALDSKVLNLSNPDFIIDTSLKTNIDTASIGMVGDIPKGTSLEVTGFVGIGEKTDGSGEPEYRVPIISDTVDGTTRFTLMGTGKDGRPRAVHTFNIGQDVHIGRELDSNFDPQKRAIGISLGDLGIYSGNSRSVSRDHLTITLRQDGLRISDHSTNGTKVEAIEKSTRPVREVGGAVASLAGGRIENIPASGSLINYVPQRGEEAFVASEIERSNRMRPAMQQLRALESKIDEIKGKYSEGQQILLTRYADEWNQKREAQKRGDGEGSYYHEREAAKALRGLPEGSRSDADHIMTLMQQAEQLHDRIFIQ